MKLTPILTVLLTSLFSLTQANATIYDDDFHTRRPMTEEEKEWAVAVGEECSGVLLNKYLLLTAHHCNNPEYRKKYEPHTSGFSLIDPEKTFQIKEIIEFSGIWGQDYQISRISWNGDGEPPQGQKYVEEIATEMDEVITGKNFESSKLYTLGLPLDKNREPTYSFGFAKRFNLLKSIRLEPASEIMFLDHNMGVDHGNSGGGIFIFGTKKLVGLALGGFKTVVNSYGVPQSRRENPADWNWGNSIAYIYKRSRILKLVFPDGKNIFTRGGQ